MAGEGLLSVAAAFLSAKARSVAGALWDLDDAASLDLPVVTDAAPPRLPPGKGRSQARGYCSGTAVIVPEVLVVFPRMTLFPKETVRPPLLTRPKLFPNTWERLRLRVPPG